MNKEGYHDPTAETAVRNAMKSWDKMTDKDIMKIKIEKCQFCKYAKRPNGDYNNRYSLYCDYMGMTHQRRGCRPDHCDKFEK